MSEFNKWKKPGWTKEDKMKLAAAYEATPKPTEADFKRIAKDLSRKDDSMAVENYFKNKETAIKKEVNKMVDVKLEDWKLDDAKMQIDQATISMYMPEFPSYDIDTGVDSAVGTSGTNASGVATPAERPTPVAQAPTADPQAEQVKAAKTISVIKTPDTPK